MPKDSDVKSMCQKSISVDGRKNQMICDFGRELEVLSIPYTTKQCSDRRSEQGLSAPWRAHKSRLRPH